MIKAYLFTLLVVSSSVVSAGVFAKEKYLVVLGGGGEPAGKTTIFDHSIKEMGKFHSRHPEYHVDISFNGGHAKTDQIIEQSFKEKKNQEFTQENFEALITKYEKMIESGEIKSGDNLLISIDSHGSTKNGNTHQISTNGESITDFEKLGEKTVSLDRLKKLTLLAEKKGINLGIIDLSCYSGNTLALANSKTCVIAGAGPKHPDVAGPGNIYFPNNLIDKLKNSHNLEEAFLKARKEKSSLTFPMISTPQGEKIQSLLYDPLVPYLYKHNSTGLDYFIPFMEEDLPKGEQCRADNGLHIIEEQINNLLPTIHSINAKDTFMKLTTAVEKYHDYIDSLKSQMNQAHLEILTQKKEFCGKLPANPLTKTPEVSHCMSYILESLLLIDFKNIYTFLEKNMSSSQNAPHKQAKHIAEYLSYKKAEQWKNSMLTKYPKIKSRQSFWNQFRDLSSKTRYHALQVIQAEKNVYDMLYRQFTTQELASNPCREFQI